MSCPSSREQVGNALQRTHDYTIQQVFRKMLMMIIASAIYILCPWAPCLAQGQLHYSGVLWLNESLSLCVFGLRKALAQSGVHRANPAGIAGGKNGATSVVLSGKYEDDVDMGNVV